MQYLLMIFNQEKDWDTADDATRQEIMQGHATLEQFLRQSGKYKACGGLAGASSATCLRITGGKQVVTDGPFAEAREQLGGYYVVDAADVDDAVAIAKKIPLQFEGMAVEIRQIAATPD
jgi:hypothetical protein